MQQIEAEQLARDLEIAAEVQANLLPVGLPELPGYQVAASLISASKIGGDFYDFCQVDGQAGSLVCDVAGKGVSAALLAAEVRSAIRSEFQHNREPGKVLRSANDRLYEDMKRVERFATIVLMCLSVDGQSCHYASAGHTTAFRIQADPLRVQALPSTTVPLGVLPEIEDISTRLDLQPNDVVVIYSDGLIEVENEQGKILGMDGLIDVLLATHLAPAQFILESLIETNTRHRGNAPVTDDLTLLVMKKVADNTPTAHYLARLRWQSEASVLPEVEAELDRLRPYLPVVDDTGTWLMQVQLAVTEVVSNIIRHSYAQRTGGIHGLVALYPDRLQIELFDRGEAYAPREIPSLDFGPTKPPESGYGLPILHRVMDTVVYERLSDGHNHWRLARSLPGATSS